MTSEGLGEMFEGDSADTCGGKFLLVSMGGRAEGLACVDPGVRTPIGVSGNFVKLQVYFRVIHFFLSLPFSLQSTLMNYHHQANKRNTITDQRRQLSQTDISIEIQFQPLPN